VKHQLAPSAAEYGTAGEYLGPDGGRLAIDRQSCRALELGELEVIETNWLRGKI
jgi:hypothetical protein